MPEAILREVHPRLRAHLGPLALLLAAASAALAQGPPAAPPQNPAAAHGNPQDDQKGEPGRPTLKSEGDSLLLSMNENSAMELKEFVKWAHELTGMRIAFTDGELNLSKQDNRVTFLGTLRFKKDAFKKDFLSFFETMLYVKGFALVRHGSGDLEVNEIVFMAGPRGREAAVANALAGGAPIIRGGDEPQGKEVAVNAPMPRLAEMLKGYVGQECVVSFGNHLYISFDSRAQGDKRKLEVVGQDFLKLSGELLIPFSSLTSITGKTP